MKKMMDLESMLSKKKDDGKEMSEQEIQAKMDVLHELMEMCQEQMGKSVKSGMDEMSALPKDMQKVTVAAPDKDGLEKGLEKAKELMESPEDEMMESPEEQAKEDEEGTEMHESPLSMMDDEDEDSMFAKKK